METGRTIKILRNKESTSQALAEKYYAIISIIFGLKLTEREIQLVAFTAIKGNISYSSYREEFCSLYGSSSATINNIISKLKKSNVFVKDASKIKVNPKILGNFKNDILLGITLKYEETTEQGNNNSN